MLSYYRSELRQWGFNRVVLQTTIDTAPTFTSTADATKTTTDDGFTTTVLYDDRPSDQCLSRSRVGRTLRVIRQPCKYGELLKLSHRFGMATGDSSLAEVISAGKAFLYDAMPHKQDTLMSLADLCATLKFKSLIRLFNATQCSPYPHSEPIKNITMNPPLQTTLGCGTDDLLELARVVVKAAQEEAQALSDHVSRKGARLVGWPGGRVVGWLGEWVVRRSWLGCTVRTCCNEQFLLLIQGPPFIILPGRGPSRPRPCQAGQTYADYFACAG